MRNISGVLEYHLSCSNFTANFLMASCHDKFSTKITAEVKNGCAESAGKTALSTKVCHGLTNL